MSKWSEPKERPPIRLLLSMKVLPFLLSSSNQHSYHEPYASSTKTKPRAEREVSKSLKIANTTLVFPFKNLKKVSCLLLKTGLKQLDVGRKYCTDVTVCMYSVVVISLLP